MKSKSTITTHTSTALARDLRRAFAREQTLFLGRRIYRVLAIRELEDGMLEVDIEPP